MLIAAVMALAFMLVFLVVYYIPSLVVEGPRVTHMRMGRFLRAVGTTPMSFSVRTGKKLVKKAVPNSFPLDRLSERISVIEMQLRELQLHYRSRISEMWPKESPGETNWGNETSLDRSSNRYKRTLLERIQYDLHPLLNHIKEGTATKGQRESFAALLGDLEALLRFTPVGEAKEYKVGPGDGRTRLVWDRDAAEIFTDEALTIFLERAGEVEEALAALKVEMEDKKIAERQASAVGVLSGLRDARLSATVNQRRGVPTLSLSTIPQEQRAIFEKARERMNSLPLIESERVKRILSDSAEAQALAKEASTNGELAFDGRTPQEMVSSILAGNAEMLSRTMEEAHGNRAADQLWALERFTEEKIMRS